MVEQVEQADLISLELCYCGLERIYRQRFMLQVGANVAQLLEQSALFEQFPELVKESVKLGVFGKLKNLDAILQDGDRLEVYRELTVDPMEARRRRVTKKAKRNTRTF